MSSEFQAVAATYGRPRTRQTDRQPVQLEPAPDTCPQCGRNVHRDNRTAGCDTCTQEDPR